MGGRSVSVPHVVLADLPRQWEVRRRPGTEGVHQQILMETNESQALVRRLYGCHAEYATLRWNSLSDADRGPADGGAPPIFACPFLFQKTR